MDGGAYRYAAEVAEGLAARNHEVHSIFPNPTHLPEQETRRGVHLHRITSPPSSFARNWSGRNAVAREILSRLDAEVHGPQLIASHHAYFEAAQKGLAQMEFFHGPWGLEYSLAQKARPRGIIRRLLDPVIAQRLHRSEARALSRCRHILVASEYMKTQLKRWHPSVLAPVEVVGGGVNLGQFRPANDRLAVRERWLLQKDAFLFLTVRRLDPRMGLLPLIEAFATVANAIPKAQLWLAGRGPQEAELRRLVESRGLSERVKLLGFVPEADLPALYQAADCTLMPSLDLEGFGLATAESLASGTPVVASDSGANPEVVRPLGDQCIFPTGDVPAMAARMRDLVLGHLPLPARTACSDYAQRHFRWDRPVTAFEIVADKLSEGVGQP
jgi:glycosyltransferase involved in cell wall biosynthesis